MRVLVCGGRYYSDWPKVLETLDQVSREKGGVSLLIHGAATGADRRGEHWAERWGIPTQAFVAQWRKDGKAAGPIRNQRMIDEGKPDLVVAFPGGKGTADMVRRARAAGVPVREIAAPASDRRGA